MTVSVLCAPKRLMQSCKDSELRSIHAAITGTALGASVVREPSASSITRLPEIRQSPNTNRRRPRRLPLLPCVRIRVPTGGRANRATRRCSSEDACVSEVRQRPHAHRRSVRQSARRPSSVRTVWSRVQSCAHRWRLQSGRTFIRHVFVALSGALHDGTRRV